MVGPEHPRSIGHSYRYRTQHCLIIIIIKGGPSLKISIVRRLKGRAARTE